MLPTQQGAAGGVLLTLGELLCLPAEAGGPGLDGGRGGAPRAGAGAVIDSSEGTLESATQVVLPVAISRAPRAAPAMAALASGIGEPNGAISRWLLQLPLCAPRFPCDAALPALY